MRLALAQYPIERPASIAAWRDKLDAWIARTGDAELLVLPEYACVELGVALCGREGDAAGEIAAVREAGPEIVATLRDCAMRHGCWLLGGSLPVRRGNATVNAAPLIAPDGRIAWQDKHRPTRFDAGPWSLSAGAPPGVFDTPWGRIGIAICYDVEFAPLVRVQVEAGAWLILVPTCTDTVAGFNRVRLAARARAIENQCLIAIAPTVGSAPWSAGLDTNRGYAAVFGPCDRGFPEDGVLARGAMDAAQWVHAALDPAVVTRVRDDGDVRNHADWPSAVPAAQPHGFA